MGDETVKWAGGIKKKQKNKNANNHQTINADADSSQRGAARRQRGSYRVDVNKMSSAIQPPALKAAVKTAYFRSSNWTLTQNYIYQQRVTHSRSAGARALSLNHYFNCCRMCQRAADCGAHWAELPASLCLPKKLLAPNYFRAIMQNKLNCRRLQ